MAYKLGQFVMSQLPMIGESIARGGADPTQFRRQQIATQMAEGELAFQPTSQALKLGDFANTQAKIGLAQGRLSFDAMKHGQDLDYKNRALEEGSRNIARRGLYQLAPEAGLAYDQGNQLGAVDLGNKARVSRAGRESGARASAAVAAQTKGKHSWAVMQEVGRRVKEARDRGEEVDPRALLAQVNQEYGQGAPIQPGKNLLTPQQRASQDTMKTLRTIYSSAVNANMDPRDALVNALGGDEAMADQVMQLFKQQVGQGLGAGGIAPSAGAQAGMQLPPTPDEDGDNDADMELEAAISQYGNPEKWPDTPELRALAARYMQGGAR